MGVCVRAWTANHCINKLKNGMSVALSINVSINVSSFFASWSFCPWRWGEVCARLSLPVDFILLPSILMCSSLLLFKRPRAFRLSHYQSISPPPRTKKTLSET